MTHPARVMSSRASGRSAARFALALGCTLLLAPGCSERGGESQDASPRAGGRAVIALDADPGTLNPVRMVTAQAARVLALVHPPLVRLDPEISRWMPAAATQWTVSEGADEIVVHLDTRLRWSDGEPFGAHDVVATFELYRDPVVAYPRLDRLRVLETIEALDAERVRFVFGEPVSDPLALLTHDLLPAHVVAQLDREDPPGWSIGRAPITLGAYRIARWDQDDRIVLERNPHHPAPGLLDGIDVVIVPDAAVRLLRLRAGEVDIVASVPASHGADLRDDPGVELVAVHGRSVAFLQFALEDPILSDLRVRKAIDLAVDRSAIVSGVLYGFADPAASFLPPASWAHDASLQATRRDLDAARALLDEAGFTLGPDGVRRSGDRDLRLRMLSMAGDPVREAIAVLLRTQLAEVGIDADVRSMDLGSAMRAVQSGEFQIFFAQVSGPVDADLRAFLASTGRFNFGRYSGAELDSLAEAAARAEDRDEARRLAARFQTLLQRELPLAYLYYPATLVAHRSRLVDVSPNWLSPFDGVERWWVRDGSRR